MATETKISELKKIPKPELTTLAMFAIGLNVRNMLSRLTYDKHRKSLAKYGYDISRQIEQETVSTKSLELASTKFL